MSLSDNIDNKAHPNLKDYLHIIVSTYINIIVIYIYIEIVKLGF